MNEETYARVMMFVKRYRKVHPYSLNIILLGQQDAYTTGISRYTDPRDAMDKITAINTVMRERGDA